MISKELKSQLSILKETNPEYIQTLKVYGKNRIN